MCFLFVFASLLTSTSSQSVKMVQKKINHPVPSVGTVAQITYNIRNNLAKQYSPQENSVVGFLYLFCDDGTCG